MGQVLRCGNSVGHPVEIISSPTGVVHSAISSNTCEGVSIGGDLYASSIVHDILYIPQVGNWKHVSAVEVVALLTNVNAWRRFYHNRCKQMGSLDSQTSVEGPHNPLYGGFLWVPQVSCPFSQSVSSFGCSDREGGVGEWGECISLTGGLSPDARPDPGYRRLATSGQFIIEDRAL